MRKIVSGDKGMRLSRSCHPTCSKWIIRPRLASMVLIPPNFRLSTYDCMTRLIRSRRRELNPASSGLSISITGDLRKPVSLYPFKQSKANRRHVSPSKQDRLDLEDPSVKSVQSAVHS